MCGLLNAVCAEQRPEHGTALFLSSSFFRSQGDKSFILVASTWKRYNTASNTNSDHFRSALGCCQAARERRRAGSWKGAWVLEKLCCDYQLVFPRSPRALKWKKSHLLLTLLRFTGLIILQSLLEFPGMDCFRPSAKPCRLYGALQDLVWTPDTSPVIRLEAYPLLSSSLPEAGSPSPPAHELCLHLFARSYVCNSGLYCFCFLFFRLFVCLGWEFCSINGEWQPEEAVWTLPWWGECDTSEGGCLDRARCKETDSKYNMTLRHCAPPPFPILLIDTQYQS